MKIIECNQYSPEWWEARCGKVTASAMDKIMTPKTMKASASQDDYIAELIGDLVCLTPRFFQDRAPATPDMQHGIDTEPQARFWYELHTDREVRQVGFCVHPNGFWGCSPDGLVGDDGGLELKCPQLKTQVKYLLAGGGLPDEYRCQVHGSLIVTGRKWWDFASYAPGLPPILVRVQPDAFTAALEKELEAFTKKYRERWDLISTAALAFRRESTTRGQHEGGNRSEGSAGSVPCEVGAG